MQTHLTLILTVKSYLPSNAYLQLRYSVVMVELDLKAALKYFNPASVISGRTVIVYQ